MRQRMWLMLTAGGVAASVACGTMALNLAAYAGLGILVHIVFEVTLFPYALLGRTTTTHNPQ